jgi:ribosomal protein S18 acetylase RimI-like enzyme
MNFSIRSATPADALGIARVHVESWNAAYRGLIPDEQIDARTVDVRLGQWASAIADGQRIVLVGCDEDADVLGFASALLFDAPDRGFESYLQTLYVGSGAWSRGIGSELLRGISERLQAAGVKNMALHVLRLNLRARAFYERLGARFLPDGIAHEAGKYDQLVYGFDDITCVCGSSSDVQRSRFSA